MADLGAASFVQGNQVTFAASYDFADPLDLGGVMLIDSGTGGGGIPVTPKRFLRVAGSAVPIQ